MTNEQTLEKIHSISLDMLSHFDKLSRKYGFKYCLACGALLGAIRHKGFIPWDNDIDIWITREDFQKFYAHKEELPQEYQLVMPTVHGNKKYLDCVPRLNYRDMYIKMDPQTCRFYNNRNNRLDLDMFFLDKTYSDYRGKLQRLELAVLYALLNGYRENHLYRELTLKYPPLFKVAGSIARTLGRIFPLTWLRHRVESVSTRYNERNDTDAFFASNDGAALGKIVPAKYVSETCYVPFEGINAPIPKEADKVLKIWFGDYMKLPPEEQRIPHWGNILITADSFVFEEPPIYNH